VRVAWVRGRGGGAGRRGRPVVPRAKPATSEGRMSDMQRDETAFSEDKTKKIAIASDNATIPTETDEPDIISRNARPHPPALFDRRLRLSISGGGTATPTLCVTTSFTRMTMIAGCVGGAGGAQLANRGPKKFRKLARGCHESS
jgi:hypothetical protein